MASTSNVDDNCKYLLLVLKHSEFKPNYRAVAAEGGINNANNAQKKFKKLVENGGYALVNGAVVSAGASGSTTPTTPTTPKKAATKKSTTTPASGKKRKILEMVAEDAEEDGGAGEGGEDAGERA